MPTETGLSVVGNRRVTDRPARHCRAALAITPAYRVAFVMTKNRGASPVSTRLQCLLDGRHGDQRRRLCLRETPSVAPRSETEALKERQPWGDVIRDVLHKSRRSSDRLTIGKRGHVPGFKARHQSAGPSPNARLRRSRNIHSRVPSPPTKRNSRTRCAIPNALAWPQNRTTNSKQSAAHSRLAPTKTLN